MINDGLDGKLSKEQIQKILKSEKKSNKEIDKLLDKDREKLNREVTLLLLGPGESGKSTIAKQLRILNSAPWSPEERQAYKEVVQSNVIKSIRDVINAANTFNYNFENTSLVEYLMESEALTPEVGAKAKALLDEDAAKKALLRSSEFSLKDSAPYYFSEIERISQPTYIPNDDDILRSRKKTTAIEETFFEIENTTCRVIDVGGQRSQRKKWIHLFQDVTAVIFCASLSCYDLKLREDAAVSRFDDSIELFDEIINNKWFTTTPVILFLNKVDLFKEKINKVPLTDYFPDYKGSTDPQEAISFIRRKFYSKSKNPDKQIHTHITCATDTNNIATVFQTVKKIILNQVVNDPHM